MFTPQLSEGRTPRPSFSRTAPVLVRLCCSFSGSQAGDICCSVSPVLTACSGAEETPFMPVAVRHDLVEAHRLAWDHVAGPGTWWTGAERVELATTVLTALFEPEPLPPWVGFSTRGLLSRSSRTLDSAHDFVYRLARHAGTITAEVHRAVADEVGELPYVELCAITSTVAAVGHFHRNVGLPVPSLPDSRPGEPSRVEPENVVAAELNWVPVAAPADESPAVVQAYTAVPDELVNTWRMAAAQYMAHKDMVHADWSRGPGSLTRPQIELVAARVAQLRECFY